jgi:ligand-binding sensor domain-containing protein
MKKLSLFLIVSLVMFSCSVHEPVSDLELVDHILRNNSIWSMAFESNGTAWISTMSGYGDGLIKIDTNGTIQVFDSENSIINDEETVRDIEIDAMDKVWMSNDGLVCYEDGVFTRYDSTNSILPQNFVKSIAIDRTDRVWASSYAGGSDYAGVIMVDNGSFQLYSEENSAIPYERVWDIEVGPDNSIWMLSNGSFINYDGTNWVEYDEDDFGFHPAYITDIAIDNKNNVCTVMDYAMSSYWEEISPALFVFNPDKTIIFNQARPISPSVFVDSENIVWCGGFQGVSVFDGSTYSQLDIKHAASIIRESPSGEIWIGGGDGVYIYKK